MSTQSKRFIRAVSLAWARLGSAQIYVAAAGCVIFVLAALGLWQLLPQQKQMGRIAGPRASPTPIAATSAQKNTKAAATPITTPVSRAVDEGARVIAIKDATETKKTGRHGETLVVATIGVVPTTNAEKGDVEIHVFFYDLTENNEIRTTDAQVTYEWLTPFRDWNDPTPKYLAATYLQPRTPRSPEKLRYGGFIVRVYAGGKLQDQRSQPEGVVSNLGSRRAQTTPRIVDATPPSAAITPPLAPSRTLTTSSPAIEKPDTGDSSMPKGKPVPGKRGFVSSPFDPKFIIDVRGFPPGTLVNDPNTGKTFRVP